MKYVCSFAPFFSFSSNHGNTKWVKTKLYTAAAGRLYTLMSVDMNVKAIVSFFCSKHIVQKSSLLWGKKTFYFSILLPRAHNYTYSINIIYIYPFIQFSGAESSKWPFNLPRPWPRNFLLVMMIDYSW